MPAIPPSGIAESSAMPSAPVHWSAQAALIAGASIGVGLLDAALVASGRGGFRGAFEYVPASLWFVAPLAAFAVALPLAGIVALLTRRKAGATVAVALALAYVAARTQGLGSSARLAIAAATLVAGIAAWRILSRWAAKPRPRAAAAGAAILVLLALGCAFARMQSRRPVPMRSGNGPNVIVVFLDTVRHDAVFARDGSVHPGLRTLSRFAAESVVFDHAYAPTSWTLPSHLSAVTGLPVERLGVDFDRQTYRLSVPTLAERFRRHGYRTAAVISNSFLHGASGFERGFDVYEHAEGALDLCRTAPGVLADRHWPWFAATVCNWSGSEVTRRAVKQLDDGDGPFLLVLNYMDAHDPYYVPGRCGGKNGYAEAVNCLDADLAPVLNWTSPRRETIVAVAGDHGEQFGEHGLERHGNSLYVQLLHVPLLIRHPGAGPGHIVDPVSLQSLPALLDAPRQRGDGRPLTAMLVPPRALGRKTQRSALDRGWHLIDTGGEVLELYDLTGDPEERRNLVRDPRHAAVVQRLRGAMIRAGSAISDPGRFRSLGYIQ